jgi:hypothetical protein
MSMPSLKESIRDLLHLQGTFPRSLTHEINVRNTDLVGLHDKFVDMASEFRLWSFYETRESTLSGSAGGSSSSNVQFGAPLVSVKSALLEVWEEDVFAVDSDHAHLACFGPGNSGILESYLADMCKAIDKAARLHLAYAHTPLHLDVHVKVEVIGFYEDPEAMAASPRPYASDDSGQDSGSIIRLYSTKHPFQDFLKKGPDRCLAERLHKGRRRRPSMRRSSGKPEAESSTRRSGKEHTGLGLPTHTSDPSQGGTTLFSPEIVVTGPTERPPLLRTPAQSEPIMRPGSPESTMSVSTTGTTVSDSVLPFPTALIDGEGHTVDLLVMQQAKLLMKDHELTTTAGFSRPDASQKKFMWVHMPFNNPVWVKDIFDTLAKPQGLDFSRLFDYDNWTSKQIQNRNSDSQPAYLKSVCKYLSAADRLTSPRISSPMYGPLQVTPNCLFLYLPDLHFDTYHSMIRRRKLTTKRRCHGRAKPVPSWVAEQESLELKVIWEYIGFDPPLNCRRTLDQFGHHSLRDTNSRDDDQMLYKLTKKDAPSPFNHMSNNASARSLNGQSWPSTSESVSSLYGDADVEFGVEPGSELKNGHVLMIDQLWMWSIDMSKPRVSRGLGVEMLTSDSHPRDMLLQARVLSHRRDALPTSGPAKQRLQRAKRRSYREDREHAGPCGDDRVACRHGPY